MHVIDDIFNNINGIFTNINKISFSRIMIKLNKQVVQGTALLKMDSL